MAKPTRGDVWLVDMGFAAKVRPARVLSVPIEGDQRVLTTVVPHTTSVRGTRIESASNVRWHKTGVFDAQGIGTYPTVELMKLLGLLPLDQLIAVEQSVLRWLGLGGPQSDG